MNHLFVPYELALKLKENGFDEPCLVTYHKELHTIIPIYAIYTNQDVIKAPLYQQIFDWFREKHKISIEIAWDPSYEYDTDGKESLWSDAIWEITLTRIKEKEYDKESPNFQRLNGKQLTYYSTLNVAIEEAIKLI